MLNLYNDYGNSSHYEVALLTSSPFVVSIVVGQLYRNLSPPVFLKAEANASNTVIAWKKIAVKTGLAF